MKRYRHAGLLVLLLGLLFLLGACGDPGSPGSRASKTEDRPLEVRTTCFPVDWLVTRIAGDSVRRINVLPEGEDPPHWQPAAEVIAGLAEADLIVINGAGFEKWMASATLPLSKVVDTSKALDLIEISGTTHSHGVNGQHSHAGTDPHTWADPQTYLIQAHAVHAALVGADPAHAESFDRNLQALTAELQTLDEEYAAALQAAEGWHLAANHPAYNYLARRYGLDIRSFDLDPGEVPTEKQLGEFLEWAEGVGQPVLLWEAEPSAQVVSALPDRVRHVTIDPLEQPEKGDSYNYLSQARANIARFQALSSDEGNGD